MNPASVPRVDPASVPRVPTPSAPKVTPNVVPQSPKRPHFPTHSYGTRYKSQAAEYLLAQHIFRCMFDIDSVANHIYDVKGRRKTLNSLCSGPNKEIWLQALSNEFGRLAQSNDAGVRHTDAIDFIK